MNEEIKESLLRVKEVKKIMDTEEQKHRNLMEALRHSGNKKRVCSFKRFNKISMGYT